MASLVKWSCAELVTDQGAVSVSDIKAQARIDWDDEDTLLESYARAATLVAERFTQRLWVRRQAVQRMADLPVGFVPVALRGGEVGSLTSFVVDGATLTGLSVVGSGPAVVWPAAEWPAVTGEGYPVVITYQCGPETCPEDVAVAIKMIAVDMFEGRGAGAQSSNSDMPFGAKALLQPHRMIVR